MRIKTITARQIINSKGYPTLQVEVSTSKNTAISSVPIAASKSKYEFYDAYDNNLNRFHGETLDTIVENVNRTIAPEFIGKNSMDQESLDKLLLSIDNSVERMHLGVNTIAATSEAIAKLGALESDLPLFKYLRVLYDFTGSPNPRLNSEYILPKPVLSIYKSSLHSAEGKLPTQEILVLPKKPFSYCQDLVPMYDALNKLNFDDRNYCLKVFLEKLAEHISGLSFKFNLGIDMAASRYKRMEINQYVIPYFSSSSIAFRSTTHKLAKAYVDFAKKYKLTYLEDLLSEDDYSGWKELYDKVNQYSDEIQVVSDDFTATNMERLEKVSLLECCNNVVIKPSQIGTVTECVHFAQRARKFNHNITVSYRHGETEDTFISDLAVGLNADFIRTGFYQGSEYVSKLNRLLQIEEEIS